MFTFMSPLLRSTAALCIAAVLGGCAGYGPQSLAAGTPRAAVVDAMGPPTGVHAPLPDSAPGVATRLEYARGPFGKHTYMLEFDGEGRLLSWVQVLNERSFGVIVNNMSQSEVTQRLGRPSNVRTVGLYERTTVWSYRYESPFCLWFEIGFQQGLVNGTGYGPDPVCEDRGDRRSMF